MHKLLKGLASATQVGGNANQNNPTLKKMMHYVWNYFQVLSITLLFSDHRCNPGWTGNRCHVKEKLSSSTSTPTPEDTRLGNKDLHLPACLY